MLLLLPVVLGSSPLPASLVLLLACVLTDDAPDVTLLRLWVAAALVLASETCVLLVVGVAAGDWVGIVVGVIVVVAVVGVVMVVVVGGFAATLPH